MKKFLIAFSVAVIFQNVNAQDFAIEWQKTIGGSGDDRIKSMQQTRDGGFILGGVSGSPLSGDKTEGSRGSYDYWVIKLDAFGNIEWQNTIGGGDDDELNSIQQTTDGGYILGGFSGSGSTGDKTENNIGPFLGYVDYWVVKLDSAGNISWQNTIGGFEDDHLYSIQQTRDGGYILGGASDSGATGDKTEDRQGVNNGTPDYWVVKLDSAGNIIWQNTIGGKNTILDPGDDIIYSIQQTTDGGYIVGGISNSDISTDKTEDALGGYDYWILKLDTVGNIVWQNTIGGSSNDNLRSIQQTTDGGYIIGGYSNSPISGDKTEAQNGIDYWVVKLDNTGNIEWQNTIGGSGADYLFSIQQTADKGYILGGYSDSGISGEKTEAGQGNFDHWVVKLDSAGSIVWQNTIGGSGADYLYSIQQTTNGSYILGGFSDSGISGDKIEAGRGGNDYWILKLSNPFGVVQGNVFKDQNGNCSIDTSDIPIPAFLLKADPGPQYGMSDVHGNYKIYLPDSSNYTVSVAGYDSLWQPTCSTNYNVQLAFFSDTVSNIDFAMSAAVNCPRLIVEIGTPILRRCFNSIFTIRYTNTGTLPASNAYIEVDFENDLVPQSSTIPWSSVNGNIYTFPIGTINIFQQGSFNVTALLDCNALRGSTRCVTAHIYPDTVCIPTSTGWDKSETKVTGTCVNDSLVCFKIKNRSSPPSGDMQGPAPWRLYVNDTLITQGTYQLAGQDSMIKCYPANGKTYRLEADQRLGHPGNSNPKAIVEACGNPANLGFVTTVPQDDADLFVETICLIVRGSFDPNDKQVIPVGITSNQYITSKDELEYLIRFQNTGTDTAFKVVVRDTIDTDVLDIATLTSGASSHDYTFNIYGHGIAEWTFDNILLPDSFVNEPESHGFVKFKIAQLPGNADGTLIENRAAIYFDYNAPVITNMAWNEVNEAALPESFLSANVIASDISCSGLSNGQASASASGGLAPYQFKWSNGDTIATVSNMLAGNYSVTIMDAAESVIIDSVQIEEPALLEAAITSKTDVLCYANGTGTASVSASGGTAPYSYEWSDTQGSQTASNLNAGTYTVTVWDANLCTATTSSVTISEPPQLSATISTQSSVTCFGGNDAAVKVIASGGVPPHSVNWSNGQTSSTANDLSAGNYQLTITDSNSCSIVTSAIIQDGYQINTGTISGADTANVNLTATYTLNPGFTYTWSVTNGIILFGQNTNSVEVEWSATGQGTLEVVVTDQGCFETVSKTITLVDPTGIQQTGFNNIQLYPNPTNGTVMVREMPSLQEMVSLSLKLSDALGRTVWRHIVPQQELRNGIVIDLKEMKEGIFFLSIKTEVGMRVMKVVKY